MGGPAVIFGLNTSLGRQVRLYTRLGYTVQREQRLLGERGPIFEVNNAGVLEVLREIKQR